MEAISNINLFLLGNMWFSIIASRVTEQRHACRQLTEIQYLVCMF